MTNPRKGSDKTAHNSHDARNDTEISDRYLTRQIQSWSELLMGVNRLKLLQIAIITIAAAIVVQLTEGEFYSNLWFWFAVSITLSATLLEPHFTAPRSAVTNAVAACAIYFAATKDTVAIMWWAYLALALLVLITSFVTLLSRSGSSVPLWISARFGRARVLGISALVIEAYRVGTSSPDDGALLLLIAGFVLVVIGPDWSRFLASKEKKWHYAIFEAAVEPNLLLFSSHSQFVTGQQVAVQNGSQSLLGHVVGTLAHKRGRRFQVVLDGDWCSLLPEAGTECTIEITDQRDSTVGFVVEGTDELAVRFHPLDDITFGESITLDGKKGPLLYQVTSLRLERDRWDESAGLQSRALAIQIGEHREGTISRRPWLPTPFQPVRRSADLSGRLPANFILIGHVSGTRIPIGVKVCWCANDGNVGVLGMSGMGKTSAVQRLAAAFEKETSFIAVDGTGEYRTKLGWDSMEQIDWEKDGVWVHEPRGLPAEKCTQIIGGAMTAANKEFDLGEPKRRLLLLEEAHTYLPEWNFATSNAEKETVSKSARYILQARKFGLSFIMVSQRTAVISKSALSQCENFLIFRAIDETSLDFIEGVVGKEYREAVLGLRRFQAVCVGPIFNVESPVIVDLLAPTTKDK